MPARVASTSKIEVDGGRADARRNREKLIAAATEAFASGQERVALEVIAREAGVGIGTLYRHFPTREALIEAVYRDQVERLHAGAQDLLERHPPARALRLWMDLFADWAATKHGMIDTLLTIVGKIDSGRTRFEIQATVAALLDQGAAAGEIREDVRAADVSATLTGILAVVGTEDRREQRGRMFDLLLDGLRTTSQK